MAGAKRIGVDLLDDSIKASIDKVKEIDDRVSAIENVGGATHTHNNFAVLQGFDFTDGLSYDGVHITFDTHNHDTLYVKKAHEENSTIHLNTAQIERIRATQTSIVSDIEPTTDVWYKIIK